MNRGETDRARNRFDRENERDGTAFRQLSLCVRASRRRPPRAIRQHISLDFIFTLVYPRLSKYCRRSLAYRFNERRRLSLDRFVDLFVVL